MALKPLPLGAIFLPFPHSPFSRNAVKKAFNVQGKLQAVGIRGIR